MSRTLMIAAVSLVVAAPLMAGDANARGKKVRVLHAQDGAAQAGYGADNTRPAFGFQDGIEAMVASAASANGVPLELARRVVKRESGGNPRAVSKGNYGLMQIRLGTARAMGYTGAAAGLLDPQTNLTYAMKYLAGAHRAAGGSHDRAVSLYARGYYYEAKRQGFSAYESPGLGVSGVAYGGYRLARALDGLALLMPTKLDIAL